MHAGLQPRYTVDALFPPSQIFPPTHWTLIAATDGPRREAALADLYRIYWRPLCAQARRLGVREDETEDMVQEFLLQFFRDQSLQRADPEAGRFRSYLVGALRHFVWRQATRSRAQKRGGGEATLLLAAIEELPAPGLPPNDERLFDAQWAQALLDHAVARLKAETQSCMEDGSPLLWSWVFDEETISYEETAAQLRITVAAVKSRLFRLRRRFRQIVREEVLRTVTSPAECEAELRYLCAALEQSELGGSTARAAA